MEEKDGGPPEKPKAQTIICIDASKRETHHAGNGFKKLFRRLRSSNYKPTQQPSSSVELQDSRRFFAGSCAGASVGVNPAGVTCATSGDAAARSSSRFDASSAEQAPVQCAELQRKGRRGSSFVARLPMRLMMSSMAPGAASAAASGEARRDGTLEGTPRGGPAAAAPARRPTNSESAAPAPQIVMHSVT